jgi:DsbC/DsbD-like thiol-disulfide interchange protein
MFIKTACGSSPTSLHPKGRGVLDGRRQVITAQVDWLLCREACVPQKSTLKIPIYEGRSVESNPAFEPAARAMVGNGADVHPSAVQDGRQVKLIVGTPQTRTKGVEFFPGNPTYFGADLPQVQKGNSGINVMIPVSKYAPSLPTRLTGILVLPNASGNGSAAHWIDVPVTKP